MATINPYLDFDGNAEEALNFYKSVFGGEFTALMRYKDMSGAECDGMKLADDELGKIMHVSLPIGNSSVLMASDALESTGQKRIVGTNFSVSINADSKEEAEKLYNDLADGGTMPMPIADAFWGAYFGMLTDKFGVQWLVNYDYNK
ncbi:MAG: VOC family protein [Pyrinomonadaceae bacterium]